MLTSNIIELKAIAAVVSKYTGAEMSHMVLTREPKHVTVVCVLKTVSPAAVTQVIQIHTNTLRRTRNTIIHRFSENFLNQVRAKRGLILVVLI